jgi:hypothetical protein
LIGLDNNRHIASLNRWHGLSYGGLLDEVRCVVGIASKACVVYDATGVGDAFGEQLAAARIYCEPFIFTNASKQGIVEGLALAIQQARTTVIDGPHRTELEAFEYDLKNGRVVYGAPASMHDDCVCAHALAWYGAERFGVTNFKRRANFGAATNASKSRPW